MILHIIVLFGISIVRHESIFMIFHESMADWNYFADIFAPREIHFDRRIGCLRSGVQGQVWKEDSPCKGRLRLRCDMVATVIRFGEPFCRMLDFALLNFANEVRNREDPRTSLEGDRFDCFEG